MFYCNIPINTCDTVVWVCSVPWCAKGHYRTCTRQTHDLKPAGFPVPVTIPNSGKVHVHECPVAIDSVPESLVQSQLNTIVKFLFTLLWSFTSTTLSIYFMLLLFTWHWSKTLLFKIHFTFMIGTARSITFLAGSSDFVVNVFSAFQS